MLAAWGALVAGGAATCRANETEAGLTSDTGESHRAVGPTGSAETAGSPQEDAQAQPQRLSMDFKDANLKDVLRTFSQETGINVIASSEVSDQPITLYLEGVTVMDALDQILRAGNLTYERPIGSDIYIVKSKKAETGATTITRVYRLKYARVSKSILAKAAASFGSRTPFEATVSPDGTSGAGGGGSREDVGIDLVLKALLTPAGAVVVDGRTNSLIVTDIPENFPRLEAALAALDVRTPQIMVDAEVIETTLSKLKDLGVEWGSGSEGDLFQLTPAKAGTKFPFSGLFGGQIGGLGLKKSTADPTITLGSLDYSKAVAVLQALERDTDTKILARPKVLTLDNESAVIRLTTNEAIGFQTASQTQTGTNTSSVERTITGVVLVVTPQVNEHGYITMMVEPSVAKTVASKISPPSGQATPRDPKTRTSRTLVRIRSGDTLVVGGLIDRSEQETLQRVPILSGIPLLGEAFKNKEIDNSSSELIVFITPRILEEPSESRLAAAGQTPAGLREQEPAGARQDVIEETLNTLERPTP